MHDYEQKQRGVLKEEHWLKVKILKLWKKLKIKIVRNETVRKRMCCCMFRGKKKTEEQKKEEAKKQAIILKLGLMQKEKDEAA